MARLGTLFVRNFTFLTNGNFNMNRIKNNFSPLVSTIKTDVAQKLKELKIPEKPKRPGNPYILFVKEMQDKVQSENPKMSKTQVFSKCAEIWNGIDPKEKDKYDGIYKHLQERYDHDLLQYQAALTDEQKVAIASLEAAKQKDRQNRKKKKELKELNKPEKPPNAYTMFLLEVSKMRNIPIKTLMGEIGEQWRNLTDTEKQVYIDKANKAKEEYEKKLIAWEQKMRLEGREDLVRKHSPKEPIKSRILKAHEESKS